MPDYRIEVILSDRKLYLYDKDRLIRAYPVVIRFGSSWTGSACIRAVARASVSR
jgi:hypothetical protein